MIGFRAAALAAAALLAAASVSAYAEPITQTGMYGYANRLPGLAGHDPASGGIAPGATLFDTNGAPISNSNPLPVSVSATVTATNLTQGPAGDAGAGWYVRPGSDANLATESGGNLSALVSGMGAPSTGAYTGDGDATQISALKGIYSRGDAAAIALGAPGESAWSGSGPGSTVAIEKRIASLLAATATDTGLAPVGSTAVEAAHVLKTGAGQLFGFQVNFLTCAQTPCWVLVMDTATVPADGGVGGLVKKAYQVGANSTAAASWPQGQPMKFATGLTIACSTSGPYTLTATAQCAISGEVR